MLQLYQRGPWNVHLDSPHLVRLEGETFPSADMSAVRRAVSEAFWAMCAADSASMPVHWYYNINDIRRDFGGWISGFNSPADRHPSSILSLSNTGTNTWADGRFTRGPRCGPRPLLYPSGLYVRCGIKEAPERCFLIWLFRCVAAGSGRTAWSSGAKLPDVVGSVILHDKLDLWKSSNGTVHYHQGTGAGYCWLCSEPWGHFLSLSCFLSHCFSFVAILCSLSVLLDPESKI